MSRIEVAAPAKINLRLLVTAREDTGFHQLETLFCGVELADGIEIGRVPSGIHFEVSGDIATGPAEDNLVVRAANVFFEATGEPGGVHIRLDKRIPSEAGLGGGSSDAAATLRGLNSLFGDPLPADRLLRLAVKLGSDVPFFLTPTPYALAWGRGERLLALPPLPPRDVLIVHPGRSMKTPAAFKRLAEIRGEEPPLEPHAIPLESLGSWEGVRDLVRNDLELATFERIKNLPNATRELIEVGARMAGMTGSGACAFGVFDAEDALAEAVGVMERMGLQSWRTRTLTRWPEVLVQD